MRAQVTLTVAEAKALIAKAIASLPEVKRALEGGKILLKGGTTVSAVAEELIGIPLRISGRITPRGTVSAKRQQGEHPHSVLIEGGRWRNVDHTIVEEATKMGKGDVVIIGANAIDPEGRAAMMIGAPGGGNPGRALAAIMAEGPTVIIASGLEKLIPGTIEEAVMACGRKGVDVAYGMAVGLAPLVGKLITEREAVSILANVKCTVIGAGGISGAEGSTTFVVEGEREEVEKILMVLESIKGAKTSGAGPSLEECEPWMGNCGDHFSCLYIRSRVNGGSLEGGKGDR
ncbi:MAG: hypothetical protein QXU06_00660 [Candidatus Bathyarchaeia archaeon]